MPAKRIRKSGRCVKAGLRSAGFSLVELVVIIILVGILAVVAIPRFVGVESYNTKGYYDRVIAGVRYAQKQAVAKRRNVCVSITTPTVSFTYAAAAGAGSGCAPSLAGPGGQNPYVISPERTGVSISPATLAFGFDALGRPINSTTFAALIGALSISVTGDGTFTFLVEPETGYVHGS